MPQRYRTVLLFGVPGAGKGTQGAILHSIPGFHHCSCGDVFRSMDMRSELGRIFYEFSSRGELVPDEVTVRMWADAMHRRMHSRVYKPEEDLLILDGIPRTVEQARLMEEHLEILNIIHLVCHDEEKMFERLRRRALRENRHDDADEKVIRNRWKVYEAETRPVLNFYDKSMIVEVDAVDSPARVHGEILNVVMPIQDAHFKEYGS